MSELPCCRLCKSKPISGQQDLLFTCPSVACPISITVFNEENWRRLMRVPAKKTGYIELESDLDINWAIGYNTAIDDMERGGE